MRFLISSALAVLAAISTGLPAPQSQAGTHGNLTTLDPVIRKRGVSYNNFRYPALFKDDAHSKVYWMYNWWSQPGGPTNVWFEFVPMLWSDAPDLTSHWFDDVEKAEMGGSCMMDIAATVAAHEKWIEPLRKYGKRIEIVSPSVTNGKRDAAGRLMGLPYLKEFMRLCKGCQIDYVGIHWYDRWNNVEYFKKHVRDAYNQFGKLVWITEFAPIDGTEMQKIWFLQQVLPWLNDQPWVYRYTYHWGAQGSLVNAEGTGLSALGKVYNVL